MAGLFGALDTPTFLNRYWQQQPLLVRGAFSGFDPSFDEHDLAGLACEEFAESRLVRGSYPQHDWQLENGPFSEARFAGLPESGWTLLVQDVEKHYPPLLSLMEHFEFLPSWRLDDLMISYAVQGGSVGPHVDQYDVFLIQVSGSKRWQIAADFCAESLPDCPLDVLREFNPEQEWVLEAGDMLYLPPNIAHYGLALDPGMTWSVGLRAPSTADLLAGLSEHLANLPGRGRHYTDPALKPDNRAGEVDKASIDQAAKLLASTLTDAADFEGFLVSFLSRYRLAQQPANPDPDVDWPDIISRLTNGESLARNPWTRLAWHACGPDARLFAAGLEVRCSFELATALCRSALPDLDTSQFSGADRDALCQLINAGHLVLFEPETD